mmetsp:Transcript_21729/g.74698  ORF Transcript_21729/g.74698 Transcript_21729/m.74698 type:complete len:235 (-) Transcript_21729:582-1286(-)
MLVSRAGPMGHKHRSKGCIHTKTSHAWSAGALCCDGACARGGCGASARGGARQFSSPRLAYGCAWRPVCGASLGRLKMARRRSASCVSIAFSTHSAARRSSFTSLAWPSSVRTSPRSRGRGDSMASKGSSMQSLQPFGHRRPLRGCSANQFAFGTRPPRLTETHWVCASNSEARKRKCFAKRCVTDKLAGAGACFAERSKPTLAPETSFSSAPACKLGTIPCLCNVATAKMACA